MLVTVTNLKRSQISIDAFDIILSRAQTTTIRLNRDLEEYESDELESLRNSGRIAFSITEDPATPDEFEDVQISMLNNRAMRVQMVDAADVTGGGTTQTVGFSLVNLSGKAVASEILIQFAVFDDENFTVPSTNGNLDSESKGTIVAGSGTAALVVKTDSNGEFECTLTNLNDTTVYLSCSPTFGGPTIDCQSTDSVAFSA